MKRFKNPITRILSIDGAGIYGLTSGKLLAHMCEHDKHFLSSNQVDLFSGISSGSVTSLILASHENPRDAIPVISEFWGQPEPWKGPERPWDYLLSMYGLYSYYGGEVFQQFLDRTFGSLTMGDLPNRVLVCAYDLSGGDGPGFSPFPTGRGAGGGQTTAGGIESMLGRLLQPSNGAMLRHWEPVMITNFLNEDWLDTRVADVAYYATAMPSMRPVKNGLADAAMYNGSPSTMSIIAAMQVDQESTREQLLFNLLGETSARLSMLSVGDGAEQPFLAQKNFTMGSMQWMMKAANPAISPWAPYWYSLQPPEQMSDTVAQTLLGKAKYFRLNPGINRVPTTPVNYMARSDMARRMIIAAIEKNVQTPVAHAAVMAAVAFVRSPLWNPDIDTSELDPADIIPPGLDPSKLDPSKLDPPKLDPKKKGPPGFGPPGFRPGGEE